MTEAKEVVAESNGKENKNEEANGEEETELESAIIRQVEYYFGDLNITRDKFLREQVQLDDGWVPLEILLRFNRLAKLSTDPEVIVKALNKSNTGLLEISDDNKKVRRNPEMPIPEMNEERRKELQARTIYAKGFPKDSVLDDLLKFFAQFEEVENVIMRKYQDKGTKKRMFKGSVFATFKTKDQAVKFFETKGHKYEDNELLILWQDDYMHQKQEEYMTKKEQRDKKHKEKKVENNTQQTEKEEFKLPTGTVLHFSEGAETMSREHLKEALEPFGFEIAYIDFKLGDKEGWIRLLKENTAKPLAEKLTDNKLKVGENEVVFRVLVDDEEKTYLERTVEEMAKRRKNMKNFQKNKGRKGGHGNKYGKKRKQDHGDDGPPRKVKASDS